MSIGINYIKLRNHIPRSRHSVLALISSISVLDAVIYYRSNYNVEDKGDYTPAYRSDVLKLSTLSIARSIALLPSNILYTFSIHCSKKENTLWNLMGMLNRRNTVHAVECDRIMYGRLTELRSDIIDKKYAVTGYLRYCLSTVVSRYRETDRVNKYLDAKYRYFGVNICFPWSREIASNHTIVAYHYWIREQIRQELIYVNPIRYATDELGIAIVGASIFAIINHKYISGMYGSTNIRALIVNNKTSLICYGILSLLDIIRNLIVSQKISV